MTETLLRELAEQIAREQFLLQWPIYGLMFVIALVIGIGAAYLGSYARKRGENFATKADFDDLLAQLKATTAVAEEVKAQVSHADWATRELKTLRRLKLEELLQTIHELQEWQDVERSARIYDSGKEAGASPLPKIELLAGLYFPELRMAILSYCQLHRQLSMEVLQAHSELLDARNNPADQQKVRLHFANNWAPLYERQLQAISAVEHQGREIMAGLVGV